MIMVDLNKNKTRLRTSIRWGSSIILIILIACYFYLYETVSPPGYCRAQQRYISDEEFIKVSVALLDWDMNRTVILYPESTETKRKDVSNLYKGIDFDSSNPNCCTVGRPQSTILGRILDSQNIFVRLNPKTSGGQVDRMGDGFFELEYSVCGRLIDSTLGLPDTGHEEITTTNYLKVIEIKSQGQRTGQK